MIDYVNTGVTYGGRRVATKKALRELISADSSKILFDVTAAFGPHAGSSIPGNVIPTGIALQVVGPDPYRSRRWYATVTRSITGKITVK